eukprot:354921-Chlamydomonas_euryale.AAC.11
MSHWMQCHSQTPTWTQPDQQPRRSSDSIGRHWSEKRKGPRLRLSGLNCVVALSRHSLLSSPIGVDSPGHTSPRHERLADRPYAYFTVISYRTFWRWNNTDRTVQPCSSVTATATEKPLRHASRACNKCYIGSKTIPGLCMTHYALLVLQVHACQPDRNRQAKAYFRGIFSRHVEGIV